MADIEQLTSINVPVSRVYEALTTEQGLGEVWTRDLKVKAETGYVNEFTFGSSTDKIITTKLVKNKTVQWEVIESDPEWVGTSISFDLVDKNGKTDVYFKHSNWREVTDCFRWCNYNWGIFLYSLKNYCEKRKGIPYQEREF